MTTSTYSLPSKRVHNILEHIKYSGDFLCDIDELEERGAQEILQEDFDIYETFKEEELEEIQGELKVIALENEVREARHIFNKIKPYDEGFDCIHSSPEDIYSRRTTYKVYYSYPVDENLRKLPKIRYPIRSATQRETKRLSGLNKLLTGQIKAGQRQGMEMTIYKHL